MSELPTFPKPQAPPESLYHYTECGLNNIYLINGYNFIETSRGTSISIKDIDGLHKVIGLFLMTSKKDLSGDEIRFLRHEMLMSQNTSPNSWALVNKKCTIEKEEKSIYLKHLNH